MTSPTTYPLTRPLTYGLTSSLGAVMGRGREGIAVDPTKLDARKLIMPTFAMPNQKTVMGAGLTCACSRMYTRFYGATPLYMQVGYFLGGLTNDYSNPDLVGEFPCPNDVELSASVQNNSNSNWVKATFNGDAIYRATATKQQQDVVYAGRVLPLWAVVSDPISMSGTAVADGSGGLGFSTTATNGAVKIKSRLKVDADTDTVVTGWISGDSQDKVLRMSAANEADQVWSTGDFVAGTGDVTTLATIAPSFIIGWYKDNNGLLAVAVFGDSVDYYFNDLRFSIRQNAGGGMWNSACRGTLLIPCANFALSSSSPLGYTGDTSFRDYVRRFAHVVAEGGGHNAFSAGAAAADVLAWNQAAHIISKQSGVLHTALRNIIPDTTSTDSYATEANQTYRQDFEPSGKADTYNALIAAAEGKWNFFDTVLDTNAAVCGTDTRKWGSPDYPSSTSPAGIHPSGTGTVGTLGGGHKRLRDQVIVPYFQSLETPTFTTPPYTP